MADETKKYLTPLDIYAADDAAVEEVAVPEWGGWLRVKGLTGTQRDRYESSITYKDGGTERVNMVDARAKLVALCVVDENGKKLFTEADVKPLGKKSALALQRVFDVARKLSGLSDSDMAEMVKDFEAGQDDD